MSDLRTIQTAYDPNPKQQSVHGCDKKFILVFGAYGSSKTTLMCQEDIQRALEHPGSLGVVFRRYYPSLRDTTQRQYLAACPPELIRRYIRTEGREQVEFVNDSITQFRCLDDSLKLGSSQYDRINVDEAGEVEEQPFRALAFGRLRGPIGPRRMIVATNPVDRTHWLYKFFVRDADADKAVFHFTTYDNWRTCNGWILPGETHLAIIAESPGAVPCPEGPAGSHTHMNVPEGYIQNLEKMSPQERKKFLLGQWGIVAPGAPMFPMFTEENHVGDFTVIHGRPVIRGWDPGQQSPACAWWQQDATDGWVKFHELIGENEPAESFVRRALTETGKYFATNPIEDYCDVAGTQSHDTGPSFTLMAKKKFSLVFRYRKLGLMRSILKMQELFGTLGMNGSPLARIHKRCELSIAAYSGGYYIDPRSPDGEPKKPNHPHDDIVDSDRYALIPSLVAATSSEESRQRLWRVA